MKKINKRAKTKIIATLGPASDTYAILRKMVLAGMDVGRFNFSHGSHSEHLKKMELVRKINKKYRRHVRILQDLEGFRVRVGKFKEGKPKSLKKNSFVWLHSGPDTGEENLIPFDYEGSLLDIGTGQEIFIGDGNIVLKVVNSTKARIKTKVIVGGVLKERKGINMPGVKIPFSGITAKDVNDMQFGIKQKVDFVAQSFVRTKKDIQEVCDIVKPKNKKCQVIAKIESREAIKNIDSIIDASDGIMVARGDMGVAIPIYQVPMVQKMIIKKCNKKKKFVITATQMLESMTEHPRPTRAEVADVANAIIDGTDFVMLSEESAAGKYPAEAVEMMDKIIKFTESNI